MLNNNIKDSKYAGFYPEVKKFIAFDFSDGPGKYIEELHKISTESTSEEENLTIINSSEKTDFPYGKGDFERATYCSSGKSYSQSDEENNTKEERLSEVEESILIKEKLVDPHAFTILTQAIFKNPVIYRQGIIGLCYLVNEAYGEELISLDELEKNKDFNEFLIQTQKWLSTVQIKLQIELMVTKRNIALGMHNGFSCQEKQTQALLKGVEHIKEAVNNKMKTLLNPSVARMKNESYKERPGSILGRDKNRFCLNFTDEKVNLLAKNVNHTLKNIQPKNRNISPEIEKDILSKLNDKVELLNEEKDVNKLAGMLSAILYYSMFCGMDLFSFSMASALIQAGASLSKAIELTGYQNVKNKIIVEDKEFYNLLVFEDLSRVFYNNINTLKEQIDNKNHHLQQAVFADTANKFLTDLEEKMTALKKLLESTIENMQKNAAIKPEALQLILKSNQLPELLEHIKKELNDSIVNRSAFKNDLVDKIFKSKSQQAVNKTNTLVATVEQLKVMTHKIFSIEPASEAAARVSK